MCVVLCSWATVCCMLVSSPCLKCTHLCGLFTQAVISSSTGIRVAHGLSFLPGVCFSFFPPGMRRHSQPWRHGVLLWIESAPPLFFDSVSSLRPRIWMSLAVALSLLLPPEFWLMSFYPMFAHCRVLQDFEMVQSPSGNPGQHYCSSPSNQSTSSDPGPCGTWAQKASYDG